MKKILSVVLYAFTFFQAAAFSVNPFDFSEKRISLWFEAMTGSTYGVMDEFVFDVKNGTDVKLSELNWDVLPWFYLGGRTGLSFSVFDFSFYGKKYFAGKSGAMHDSDWLKADEPDLKTTYSISENKITDMYSIGTEFKVSAMKNRHFDLKGTLGFDFSCIFMEARNGYGWYGNYVNPIVSWDDEDAVYFDKGILLGVDYERFSVYFWSGLELCVTPVERFTFGGSFAVSPWRRLDSLDTHYGGLTYYDSTNSFFDSVKTDAFVLFCMNDFVSVKASFSFLQSSLAVGLDSYAYMDGYLEYTGVEAFHSGNSERLWTWTLSCIARTR